MCFDNPEIILKGIAVLASIAGGAFTIHRWRRDNRLKRMERFNELVSLVRNKANLTEVIYLLDDDSEKWFSADFSDKDRRGPWLDELLLHFCHVLNLKNNGFVGEIEFGSLAYEIDRCLCNRQLQDYLFNLRMYAKRKNQESGVKELSFPFGPLVEYGLKRGFLLKSAFENDIQQPWMHDYYTQWINDEQKGEF